MENALSPAFVEIFSHSAFGPHVQILPTLAYDPDTEKFDVWVGSPIDAATMITALVTVLKPFFPTTYGFDNWRVFTKADAEAIPLLVLAGSFTSVAGTNSSPGWTKAVQRTLSALGHAGSKVRLVMLDAASNNSFDPETTVPSMSALSDLMDEWTAASNGWATRAGEQPRTFLELTTTLNEKLRRAYRMF